MIIFTPSPYQCEHILGCTIDPIESCYFHEYNEGILLKNQVCTAGKRGNEIGCCFDCDNEKCPYFEYIKTNYGIKWIMQKKVYRDLKNEFISRQKSL